MAGKIRKKDSTAILNSLFGGVVPNRGLEHIMVGRKAEVTQILKDLETVRDGASVIKFIIGPFGSGKTFLQALIQQVAFGEKFVVGKVDFDANRRLYGSGGKSVATYSEMMKNLSIATSPDGNALPMILEQWISDVQTKTMQEKGYGSVAYDDPQFIIDVENAIAEGATKMDRLVGGFDFVRVLMQYFKGFVEDDNFLQRSALRWLRGEYSTKTEARADLGVRGIIDDSNYYDYIKVIAQFVRQIGYSGLIVNFDEAINLYKITHPQSRDKNYETILKIFNDTLQGNVSGLYIIFSGTPEFLEDERRGLYSYEAIKRRLVLNKFESSDFRDLSQPVMKLTPLKQEELYLLLQNLVEIHAFHYDYEPEVSGEEIRSFIIQEYARPGALENLTASDIIRNFIGGLNILQQNTGFDRSKIFGDQENSKFEPPKNVAAGRFSSAKI
ncbi:MAG TPA: ATP-binding protein [Desulfosporosinus sp.]|nr:ATP-binding protein [Desulfosporosinus sp.]